MNVLPENLFERLEAMAEEADRSSAWPAASWDGLCSAGVPGWSIPTESGGTGLKPVELLAGFEQIARRCLTTAFILSQREAAVRHLLKGPTHLKDRFLPQLVTGETYLTVGLSQLTTSRQHLGPALRAMPLSEGGYQLEGEIPWVTGADRAIAVVAGATLPDARQLLVVVPAERLTGMIEPPLPLAAIIGSRTSLIRCQSVKVGPDCILAGPAESVLGKIGGGGLDTSCLAIGLSAAAIDFIQRESDARAELKLVASRFTSALSEARRRLHHLAEFATDPTEALALRLDCTKLVLRATQAALMVAKGVGFVAPHPAQRWIRQAMFFLVWSCPRPVAEGVLADLAAW
jgi:butyryl-CoA dehydrogenase